MVQNNYPTRKRKSVKLTKTEQAALRTAAKRFGTAIEAAETIGVDRNTLNRVILIGSGSPDSIEKIRAFIGDFQKAA